MATEVLQIRIIASGGQQVQRESQKARSGLVGMEGSAKKAQSAFVTSAKSILRFTAISAGIGSAAVAIKNIASATIGFDKAMRNVNSIAQLSEEAFEDVRQGVLALAGPTAQSPVTLAQGMYDLVSSGFDAAEALKIVEASAYAATAGLTTTDVSTKAVAAVLNAYRKPASAAASVSDTLFRTVDRGVISFEELASNIGTVLPFAASAGINLREVGASIATMTKQGIGGANAITFLKNSYVAFNKPSSDLNKAIKATGFESGEALIKAKGFQGALEAVIGTTDGSKKAVADLFPNIRALTAVLALTGGNAKQAGKDLAGMQKDSGATAKALEQQSKSIAFQWNRLKAEASVLAIQVGDKLKPALASALGGVSSFLAGLGSGDSAIRRFMASVVSAPLVVNAFNLIKNSIMAVISVAKFLVNVGQSVASMLSPVTSLAGKFLQSEAAVRVFNAALGALAGLLAANLARAAAWLGILAVAKVIAFANAIRNAGSALIALRVAMATNPFGILLAGVGLVAGALGVFGGKSKEAAVSQQELAGAIQQTRDAIDRLNDADLEHAQLVLNAARAETGLEEALKNRRTLVASGTATALQEKQADLAVKQARLDLTRETQRLNRSERDRSSTRRKDSADATASLEPLRKRREQIRGEIGDIKDQIKAQQQQRTRIQKGGGDTGSIDKAIARDRERLADKTNELKQQERELRAEQNRLKSAMEGAGPAARSLARRYADFPKAVKTILKTEDAGALRSLKNLSGKLEGVGRKRTVARILASSSTAEQAIGRLKRLLDSIKSKNVKVTVTETVKRLGLNTPGHKTKTDRSALTGEHYRGGKVTTPMAIVGEESPRHPEFVIATNPRYRQRNVGLLGAAGKALGVPGFAQGGVVSVPQVQKLVEREIGRAPMFAEGGVLHQVPLNIDLTQIGLKAFGKADYPDYSVQVDAPRAPGGGGDVGTGGGGDPGKWSGGTLAFAAALSKMFGLTVTSTWRSPSHNRAVGGVPNSMHTHGSLVNPGAIDFLPPSGAAANYARAAGVPEVLIHDAGSGLHLHLGFFKQGGIMTKIGKLVGASVFGGSGDPATGTKGYKGDSLPGTNSYAELRMGTALGGLPYKQKLWVEHKGRTEKAFKRDIGKGGGAVDGLSRDIDLWYQLANQLGLSGLGVVRVSGVGPPGKEKDPRPQTKTQKKHKKPSGRAGSRRPLEIPEAVTALDKLWDTGYGEKVQVYENLKRQLEASPLSIQEIHEIMGVTGATKDSLEGPQLAQPEINRLVVEQESILEFLKTQVYKAADRARGALLSSIKLLVRLTNETRDQITHETNVIHRRAEELADTKAHKKKLEKEQSERKNPSKSLDRKIGADDTTITKLERDIQNRKERRTRLEGRVETYQEKRNEFSTTFGTIYDRQTKYSVGDSIKQAIDDTAFNIGELKGTKPPGADATGADGNVDDELVGLLKQQLQDVRRELASERAQAPAFSGVFHQGGDVRGTGEKAAIVEGGERVLPKNWRKEVSGGGAPQVNISISGDRALAAALRDAIDVVVTEAADQIGAKAASGSRTPVAGRLARFGS